MTSIRSKLIAPFWVGMIALTLILSWYTYTSSTRAVELSVLNISEARTDQTETAMRLLFRSLLSTIQNIVVDPHVTSIFSNLSESADAHTTDARDANEWMEILVQGNDYYRDIFLTDGKGVCIASSNPGLIGKNFGGMVSVQKALAGMFVLDEFSVGMITKKLSTTVAGPVDVASAIVGTLVVICDFPNIVNYDKPDAIATMLLEPDGTFAAHPNSKMTGRGAPAFPELYAELAKAGRNGGPVRYSIGEEQYIGYAKVEAASKWVVLTSGLRREVFAPARAVGMTVFYISIAVFCILSFIVTKVANGVLDNLLYLIQYAQHVAENGESEEAGGSAFVSELEPTHRNDELGVLQNSLKKLVDTLREMLHKTQEVSRMKGEFLANMSHEIRTPINAIMGMAHLALRDTEMSSKQRDYLDKIQTAARSLLGVINDILDISKIEAGKLTLEYVSFDFRRTIDDVRAIHNINAQAKSLHLDAQIDPAIPERLIGDPMRLGQILNNIISNAVKFTKRGSITIRCALESLEERRARIRITIADTGIGISEESQKKLFQPFTQADASITRQFGGTGLGLAITKSLIAMMDGTLELRSTPGKGSEFTITLSLLEDVSTDHEEDASLPTEEDFAALALSGRVILIAEDNMINQSILEELVAPTKASVILADNGKEAVDLVASRAIDLIFMDMQMPVMDGIQATREIRASRLAPDLPIIAVTANAMKEDRERGMACGMNDYITKPIEIDQLYRVLKKWLG